MLRNEFRSPKSIHQSKRELRKRSTPAERALWESLRRGNLNGLKFRRQYPIKGFIVDFYCASAQLVIEVEGGIHSGEEQRLADRERRSVLRGLGLRILRFSNHSILNRLEWVLARIERATMQEPRTSPHAH